MENFILPNRTEKNNDSFMSYLKKSIDAFSDITDIPIAYLDTSFEVNSIVNEDKKICKIFSSFNESESVCRNGLKSACKFAANLGEPYIFLCRSGLTNIAIALIIEEKTIGYIIAGPIIMGEIRNSTLTKFTHMNNLNKSEEHVAKMFCSTMPSYEPNKISELAILLYNSVISSIGVNKDYQNLRETYKDERAISYKIKNSQDEDSSDNSLDLENQLVKTIINGQTEEALKQADQLFEVFYIRERGDLPSIKGKMLWLFAIIIRAATEKHSSINEIINSEMDIIVKLSDVENYHQLKTESTNLIIKISKNLLTSVYDGNSKIVSNAIKYVNSNYAKRITLKDIEDNMHVNSSYFSSLFKNEMGVTFISYINQVKIDYACNLLKDSNLSIIDIALEIGFDDQSYFTKVFKKQCSMTPKEYRLLNNSK
ncbi:MAG TPA: AraC family transcriptional regulator [Anaerovoracaceae bacterium]|nr:AraC family transcriptional regulator [Anaerovoracaceae bacterium]